MECKVTKVIHPGQFFAQTGDAKKFGDFDQLVKLIQGYCDSRQTHFHSVSNVTKDEILFVKSANRSGVYARAKVTDISSHQKCSVLLIDYGDLETEVDSVLKIDPSVQKFAEIPAFAEKYSLAFIRPSEGRWSDRATELFTNLCTDKLIYLPTEESRYITLIERPKNQSCMRDVSVVLIQEGYAQRIAGVADDGTVSPSIAASISNTSQQLHTVAVQTDNTITVTSSTSPNVSSTPPPKPHQTTGTEATSTFTPTHSSHSPRTSTNLVRPPPGFEAPSSIATAQHNRAQLNGAQHNGGAGDGMKLPITGEENRSKKSTGHEAKAKASSVYVPPALRAGVPNKAKRYSLFKLSHDSDCVCLICSIRNILEMDDLTNAERLDTILSVGWPKLTTKEEAILRCSITGTLLPSEDRELLLDVMLGLYKSDQQHSDDKKSKTRRKSLDSSTQVSSTLNKLTLSTYDTSTTLSSESVPVNTDEITILSHKHSNAASLRSAATAYTDAAENDSIIQSNHQPVSQGGSILSGPGTQSGRQSELSSSLTTRTAAAAVPDYDPMNWSDPDQDFMSDSDSDPDVILETSSVSTVQYNHTSENREQYADRYSRVQDESIPYMSRSTPESPYRPVVTPESPYRPAVRDNTNMGATFITNYTVTSQQRNNAPPLDDNPKPYSYNTNRPREDGTAIGTSSEHPPRIAEPKSRYTPPRSIGRGRGDSPRSRSTKVMSYGLGLSATRRNNEPEKPKYNFHQVEPLGSPLHDGMSADDDSDVGGFGMIMYCTFCGSTVHRSAACPDGTRNLFLQQK